MSLGAIFAGASLGMSIFGAKKSSKAAKSAGKAEAAIHEQNARFNEEEAEFTLRQNLEGQIQISRDREEALGIVRTKQGKGGYGGVTAYEVQAEVAERYARNKATYSTQMERQRQKLLNAAKLDRGKAYAAKKGASSASTAAWINAGADMARFGAQGGFDPIIDLFG